MNNEPRAVVLIISHKETLTKNEEISIKQCSKVLANRDLYFILPKDLNTTYYSKNFPTIMQYFVAPKWLSSYEQSNRFKVLPYLYKTFSKYDYILFHEPDAYVFKDELDYWMEKDFDYIGAPWFDNFDQAHESAKIIGVGNSGLSLRKVKSHLKATKSFSYIKKTKDIIKKNNQIFNYSFGGKLFGFWSLIKQLTFTNNTHHCFNNYNGQEDFFWGVYVPNNFKWFKVAPIEDAIKFSFEIYPNKLFKMNNEQLPFGCHAWEKYNYDFWKKYIPSSQE
jgi:hypothetical protein